MYRDNSLIPREAIRMATLGALVERERSYNDVSSEVRNFISRIVGPSLDLLGTSIELLKVEGLIEEGQQSDTLDEETLRLSDSGMKELKEYLRSNVRSGGSDLNKLVVALKLRFIDVLDPEHKLDELLGLKTMYESEKARLSDLQTQSQWLTGLLKESLKLELSIAQDRINWCSDRIESMRK